MRRRPKSLLVIVAFALCALLLMAGPAAAAPPKAYGVAMESRTASTVDVAANFESDEPATFHFEYGPTTAYGSQTPEANNQTLLGGNTYRARQTITGLSSGTRYHVRVVVTNGSGTVPGPDSEIQTQDADSDGDGTPDHIDACPNAPAQGNNGCPQADADGDGTPDSGDSCPNMPGSGGPNTFPGCPPPGTPTIRTDPVQITPQGVLFKATGNSMGRGGFVRFQISRFEDFQPRGSVEQSSTECWQKTGAKDIDGRDQYEAQFKLHPGNPGEAYYRDAEVTCLSDPAAPNGVREILNSGRKLYVRAILSYNDGQSREIAGGTQTYIAPGDGDGGDCVVGPDSECGTGGQIATALTQALAVSGKAAKIGAIVKAGGFAAPFAAPSAGKAAIVWSVVPKGTKLAAAKSVVVAKGAKRITRAGKVKIKVRLTSKGRALLKRSKKVKLVARGTFDPTRGKTVSTKRTITLKR